jgi:hypothetical protein
LDPAPKTARSGTAFTQDSTHDALRVARARMAS